MLVEIRPCTVTELEEAPNCAALLAEYACESSTDELGAVCPQFDTYRKLEASGMFHMLGAFEDGRMVGFIVALVVVLPHYGVLAATVESFFVPLAERRKGIGLKLLRAAEQLAHGLGAKALLISAPVDSALADMLHLKRSYRHSNNVFVRALA